jgi:hypothetical protein
MGNKLSEFRETSNDDDDNDDDDDDKLKPKSFSQILDYISTYYILTMDFKSLQNLHQKEYCDNLVLLTSDIIERYFTDRELTYLSQRVRSGVEVNELEKDKFIFFDKDQLNQYDIQNSIKKKRICNSIAKFYIKIGHIFAAIVTTINPVYAFKDEEGNLQEVNLSEKGEIPTNVPRNIQKLNICENRIDALKNNHTMIPDVNNDITIGPKLCDMNLDSEDGHEKMLSEEPGINELEELYFDDDYNMETGTFNGMSEKTRKNYENDLKIFYQVFSGNPEIPENIKKFGDIKLREYNKLEKCQGDDASFRREVRGPQTNSLFKKYAENLQRMIYDANKNQLSLLEIINKLFVYTVDPQTKKKQIRISPALTEEKLSQIVIDTRAMIIKLYLKCEMDYVEGLKIYEAIVEQKIFDTATSQIEKLEEMSEQIMSMEDDEHGNIMLDEELEDQIEDILPPDSVEEIESAKVSPNLAENGIQFDMGDKLDDNMQPINFGSELGPNLGEEMSPTNMPAVLPPNLDANMPTELQTNLYANMPTGLPPNLDANMPAPMPAGLQPNFDTNMPPKLDANMPAGLPPKLDANMPPPMPVGLPPNLDANMPPPMPAGLPPNLDANMPTGLPLKLDTNIPAELPRQNVPLPPALPQANLIPPNLAERKPTPMPPK